MYLKTANLLKEWFEIIEGIKDERDEWDLTPSVIFSLKVCYNDLKGNVGDCETICRVTTYEEATEMLSSFIKNNNTEDYFNREGYNCFYIESSFDGEVLDIKDNFDTGYFEEGYFECVEGEWVEEGEYVEESECE